MANMTLTGGNDATAQQMNYYNQFKTQLSSNYKPVQAQVIEAPAAVQHIQTPSQITPHLIEAPEAIQAERINVDRQNFGQMADELNTYLSKYLDNAVNQRRNQTKVQRAAADVDAASRGMGPSTWLSDAKNRMAAQEAADIIAAQNQYIGQLGEQAASMWNANENRWLTAEQQNVANALQAAQLNANYRYNTALANAEAMTNADLANLNTAIQVAQFNAGLDQDYNDALVRIAMQNAANNLSEQEINNSLQQYLEQLAGGWAGQMGELNPIVTGGGGGGGAAAKEDLSGVSTPNLLLETIKNNLSNSNATQKKQSSAQYIEKTPTNVLDRSNKNTTMLNRANKTLHVSMPSTKLKFNTTKA